MDNFYQNGASHHGFIYQNPSYTNSEYAHPATYHRPHHAGKKSGNLKLATIYVKPQVYNGISSPAVAFEQGTAFVELYKPFIGKGGQR